jgi:hypothetical protein
MAHLAEPITDADVQSRQDHYQCALVLRNGFGVTRHPLSALARVIRQNNHGCLFVRKGPNKRFEWTQL